MGEASKGNFQGSQFFCNYPKCKDTPHALTKARGPNGGNRQRKQTLSDTCQTAELRGRGDTAAAGTFCPSQTGPSDPQRPTKELLE